MGLSGVNRDRSSYTVDRARLGNGDVRMITPNLYRQFDYVDLLAIFCRREGLTLEQATKFPRAQIEAMLIHRKVRQ